ncbi:MAG: alanine--tRNA ligase [Planctomycetota bacterium]|nr:alanine--tRNA ligase [Planctomycetota bacterium]MCX8039667.1 alanine--tRNA ligase [Planctomycetota bacterium]MDW8372245.1 alanine--tRNA ligase [Planctomycetota bacterium]
MQRPYTVAEVRRSFLEFFAGKGCVRLPSASLVPENDPTTLFIVAGMSPFKDAFLGRGSLPYTRVTTCQKCIRTTDILNVGRTARHHTFFEMLGNFSFNDYFKRETIHWAWEYLTAWLGLDPERLSVSVHEIDDEAYRIWRDEIGMPERRIFRLGDADNFWPANAPREGIEGPGGCCSEIFWDHRTNDDPSDDLTRGSGRFVEIWNLVFPEFNVRKPHPDGSPNLEALGRRNIDTGSGLERLSAVVQGVYNNFDIDLFRTIIARVAEVSGAAYDPQVPLSATTPQAERNALLRRIADHVRAVTFCIADGALPGNSDRGYIVRRLIRRATLDLDKLGCREPRLAEIVPAVVAAMGEAYPEIRQRQALAMETLQAEEQLFRRTLHRGLELFQRVLERQRGSGVFSGRDAFELVTTHGFPKEVIAELAGAEGLRIDEEAYAACWREHQRVSTSKGAEVWVCSALQDAKPRLGATRFVGYETLRSPCRILLLEVEGRAVEAAPAGSAVRLALDQTPFYAESGGQVADTGIVRGEDFVIEIEDVQKDESLFVHRGRVRQGTARPGPALAEVDGERRRATTCHHSATHLLHAALGRLIGAHIEQQGSKVAPDCLRFDVNHPRAFTREELARVEAWVNQQIAARLPVQIRELPLEEARRLGAKAMFGEKYGAIVRVVGMGDEQAPVSLEFCGGCHVANTAEIGSFRIVAEGASAAGIRRLQAVAGPAAQRLAEQERQLAEAAGRAVGLLSIDDPRIVHEVAQLLKCQLEEVPERVGQLARECLAATRAHPTLSGDLRERVQALLQAQKAARRRAEQEAAQAAVAQAARVAAAIEDCGGVPLIAARCDGLDGKALAALCEAVRSQRADAVIVLASAHEDRAHLCVAVPPPWQARGLQASAIVAASAPHIGGGGGGRPEFAQAGGKQPQGIAEALASARAAVARAIAMAR